MLLESTDDHHSFYAIVTTAIQCSISKQIRVNPLEDKDSHAGYSLHMYHNMIHLWITVYIYQPER